MFSIDSFAYKNKLINVHPIEKILFTTITMAICLLSSSIKMYLLILILMSCLTIFKARISRKFYAKLLLLPLSFLFFGIISIAITNVSGGVNTLISVKIFNSIYAVTHESLIAAVKLFFKSLASVSCLYFMVLTTPIIDVIAVFRKLKIPEIFLELLSLTYRLIFILIGIVGNIYTSQSSRLGYNTIKNQYKSLGYLVSTLFILSYKKTNHLFTALEARCYTGKLNVISKNYKFSSKNIIFIIFIDSLLVFLAIISR